MRFVADRCSVKRRLAVSWSTCWTSGSVVHAVTSVRPRLTTATSSIPKPVAKTTAAFRLRNRIFIVTLSRRHLAAVASHAFTAGHTSLKTIAQNRIHSVYLFCVLLWSLLLYQMLWRIGVDYMQMSIYTCARTNRVINLVNHETTLLPST